MTCEWCDAMDGKLVLLAVQQKRTLFTGGVLQGIGEAHGGHG